MAPLEVLDDFRRDQNVDRSDDRQTQPRGQDRGHIGRLPGKASQCGQAQGYFAELPLMPAQQIPRGDSQADADQRRRRPSPPPRGRNRSDHDKRAEEYGLPPGLGNALPCVDELQDRAGGHRARRTGEPHHRVELKDHHHGADAAREARDNGMRHLGDVTAQAEHAEHHHEDGRRQADLGGTARTLLPHRRRDERDRRAGRAADQNRIAAENARHGRCQDRREQAEFWRQAHEPCERQAIGERHQGGDGTPRGVSRQVAEAVATTACQRSPREPIRHS